MSYRTYMTSGATRTVAQARNFCQSQHSTGLVTWDTEDSYRDVKYIALICLGLFFGPFFGPFFETAYCNLTQSKKFMHMFLSN